MALPKRGIGTSLIGFLRATIAGGLLFLLPVVLIVVGLGYAIRLGVKVAKPISDLLPVDAVVGVGGVPRCILAGCNLVVRWPSLLARMRAGASCAGPRTLFWAVSRNTDW